MCKMENTSLLEGCGLALNFLVSQDVLTRVVVLIVSDQFLNTYATLCFRDWRSAVSLCHKNRTKIIGLVCEQKPYPRPEYPV